MGWIVAIALILAAFIIIVWGASRAQWHASEDHRAMTSASTEQAESRGKAVLYRNRFEGLAYVCEPDPCDVKRATEFHLESPDLDAEPWKQLLRVIDQAATDGRDDFVPGQEVAPDLWSRVVGLPVTISTLSNVTRMRLYGSNLVAIPWQIGDMASLQVFEPYCSHRLHWYPYEITRCIALRESTVSTRVLYGNRKNWLPFPKLPAPTPLGSTPPVCSVCRGPFSSSGPVQAWISLRVATDVLPLLVHACSSYCLRSLPTPAEGYIARPHLGGPDRHPATAL